MDTYLVCGGLRLRLYFCFFFTPASNCGGGWFCFVSVRQRFCAEKMTRLTMGTDETTSSHRIFLFFHGCRHAPHPPLIEFHTKNMRKVHTEQTPSCLGFFLPFIHSLTHNLIVPTASIHSLVLFYNYDGN